MPGKHSRGGHMATEEEDDQKTPGKERDLEKMWTAGNEWRDGERWRWKCGK